MPDTQTPLPETLAQVEYRQRYVDVHSPAVDGYLYHCTPAENILSIMANGLSPAQGETQFESDLLRPDAVYLCDRLWAGFNLSGGGDIDYGDACFAVPLSALRLHDLVSDEEPFRDRSGEQEQTYAALAQRFPWMDHDACVAIGLIQGSVAHHGNIDPDQLELVHVAFRQDLPDEMEAARLCGVTPAKRSSRRSPLRLTTDGPGTAIDGSSHSRSNNWQSTPAAIELLADAIKALMSDIPDSASWLALPPSQ
jgi:hypothetical protein